MLDNAAMDERFQKLTDYELEEHVRSTSHNPLDLHAALKEIDRRKKLKESKDRKTQRDIKYLTLAVLIVALVTLAVTVGQCFK